MSINPTFKDRAKNILYYFLIAGIIQGFVAVFFANGNIEALNDPQVLTKVMLVSGIIDVIVFYLMNRKLIHDSMNRLESVSNVLKRSLSFFGIAYLTSVTLSIVVSRILPNNQAANQQTLDGLFISNPLAILFVVVIVAPIAEELVFRYAMISFKSEKSILISWIVSSLLFGFAHIAQAISEGHLEEMWFLLVYGALGFVLGYVYLKTKNIMYPIFVHAIYNLFNVMLMFFLL